MLIDFDHGVVEVERPIRDQGIYKRDVRVGHNVWVGYGACFLRGVTVGDNAVIGTYAVVTKDVPRQRRRRRRAGARAAHARRAADAALGLSAAGRRARRRRSALERSAERHAPRRSSPRCDEPCRRRRRSAGVAARPARRPGRGQRTSPGGDASSTTAAGRLARSSRARRSVAPLADGLGEPHGAALEQAAASRIGRRRGADGAGAAFAAAGRAPTRVASASRDGQVEHGRDDRDGSGARSPERSIGGGRRPAVRWTPSARRPCSRRCRGTPGPTRRASAATTSRRAGRGLPKSDGENSPVVWTRPATVAALGRRRPRRRRGRGDEPSI